MTTSTPGLHDPALYAAGPPHELFTHLRRTDPVHWQEVPGQAGYWAILRHADVEYVSQNPAVFSAEAGGIVLEDLEPERLEALRGTLLAMDPPRHRAYRKPLVKSFTARVVGGMEDRIRTICREILDRVGTGEVEFVHDVTGALPTQVIGELMGLPPQDWAYIHTLAERNTSGSGGTASIEMARYAVGFAARRRAEEPRPDITSLILDAEFGGAPMSDVDFGLFFVQLVTAGNDTTKTMLSAGLDALLDHPDQLAMVRADRSAIPGAVEEVLRWANPLHYFRRTATRDVELRGVRIRAGDKVAMYYTSANRDEEVFPDPQRFDVTRKPNPHLSFGFAEHFCLGVHIARLEGRVFFEELLDRYPHIERTGTPRRLASNLNNALTALPVRLG